VIARYATIEAGVDIHPNDDVNMGQSSNDIIPTAIHVSAAYHTKNQLLPALQKLKETINTKAKSLENVTKTGRTHLMDAMPVTMGQELSGWSQQIQNGIVRIESAMTDVLKLAIGGTAVGTGINAHPDFSQKVVAALSQETKLSFQTSPNRFESLSTQDAIVALSGQIRVIAVSLMKIANDLRWMNSGPLAGIGEIYLPALQPGSSIMPGKVNPVICESTMMVCAQVMGNDTAITVSGQHGNFQLNVMLPVIAYNILQSIQLIANTATVLAEKAIAGFTINEININEKLSKNPILVTALNPVIGYELGAKIAKTAYAENRPLLEVALEMTDLSESEIKSYLDPFILTKGGLIGK
jgi:fumarate hydratase class II